MKCEKHKHLSQQLEVLSREHAPTQTMLKQLVDMRQQLKELQQQETVAKELEVQRNALTLLGVISETAQKTKGRLRVTKLELTNFQNAGKVDGASTAAQPPGGLVLTGVSLDNPAVAELLDGLQHSGVIQPGGLVDAQGTRRQGYVAAGLRSPVRVLRGLDECE